MSASSVDALRVGNPGTARELAAIVGMPPDQRVELENWAAHLRVIRGLSDRTTTLYLRAARKFFRFLTVQTIDFAHASAANVEAWQQHLYVVERACGTTRALNLTAVRRLYVWRELRGLGAGPARVVPAPKISRRQPRKYNADQLRALFRACDRSTNVGRRNYAFMLFLYSTGARREEMATLSLQQLDLQDRVGRVRIFGKGAKERLVPFERPLVDALRAYFADRDQVASDEAVWIALRGAHRGARISLHGMERIFTGTAHAAGLRPPNGLHRMRVTFATDMYDECRDIERVRVLMGHESIETTRRYIAISETQMKTRMPARRIYELTGEKPHGTPLWAQRKLNRTS